MGFRAERSGQGRERRWMGCFLKVSSKLFQFRRLYVTHIFKFAEIHKKRGPIPGKKYGTKKSKLLKQQQEALQFGNASANLKNGFIGYQPDNQTSSSNVNNSFEGSDNCGLTSRSKNTSPVPSKSEK